MPRILLPLLLVIALAGCQRMRESRSAQHLWAEMRSQASETVTHYHAALVSGDTATLRRLSDDTTGIVNAPPQPDLAGPIRVKRFSYYADEAQVLVVYRRDGRPTLGSYRLVWRGDGWKVDQFYSMVEID
ncbi:MAG TPA: hypothetical protein VNP72_05645 [Longimicrobium sp.]|nr:hypothetical protein [Longimicrobium sp.]